MNDLVRETAQAFAKKYAKHYALDPERAMREGFIESVFEHYYKVIKEELDSKYIQTPERKEERLAEAILEYEAEKHRREIAEDVIDTIRDILEGEY